MARRRKYQQQRLIHAMAVSRLTLPDVTTRYFRYALDWFVAHANTNFSPFRDWLANEPVWDELLGDEDEDWIPEPVDTPEPTEVPDRGMTDQGVVPDPEQIKPPPEARMMSWPPPPWEPSQTVPEAPRVTHSHAHDGRHDFFVDVVVHGRPLRIRDRVSEQDAFEVFAELERFIMLKKEDARLFDTMTGEIILVRTSLDGASYGQRRSRLH